MFHTIYDKRQNFASTLSEKRAHPGKARGLSRSQSEEDDIHADDAPPHAPNPEDKCKHNIARNARLADTHLDQCEDEIQKSNEHLGKALEHANHADMFKERLKKGNERLTRLNKRKEEEEQEEEQRAQDGVQADDVQPSDNTDISDISDSSDISDIPDSGDDGDAEGMSADEALSGLDRKKPRITPKEQGCSNANEEDEAGQDGADGEKEGSKANSLRGRSRVMAALKNAFAVMANPDGVCRCHLCQAESGLRVKTPRMRIVTGAEQCIFFGGKSQKHSLNHRVRQMRPKL